MLICEPEGGAWVDWFMVDDGTNLENAEAITRALSRRISEHRKQEQQASQQTATEKELTVAKLTLLHAQVEPHFLYNTLASAQLLTRSDPARADEMLGNLIVYLRNSLPRTEGEMSTLAAELERARAYLEIMKIRMGERLSVQIQVPEGVKGTPMPPMMLQTLVENAIKHGLEPVTGGGNIWIIARDAGSKVSVTGGGRRTRAGRRQRRHGRGTAQHPRTAEARLRRRRELYHGTQLPQRSRGHPGRPCPWLERSSRKTKPCCGRSWSRYCAARGPSSTSPPSARTAPRPSMRSTRCAPRWRSSTSACPASPGWRSRPPRPQASPGTQVVFVTAYNQYAIDAFERGAVDYL
jgi:hypothetical protein